MSRSVVFAPGELYHLYNRGTEKRRVFLDRIDHERFLALMFFCNSNDTVRIEDLAQSGRSLLSMFATHERGETLVDLCAYALMPNHFHMLVREKSDDGISRFMQKLTTGYTMYFNTRNERTGSLFQGRFKAQHVHDDRYLKYLVAYLHLNPIKLIEKSWKETGISDRAKADRHLQTYRYSSYLDYTGAKRLEWNILNMNALSEYYDFATPSDFKSHVSEWLDTAGAFRPLP